MSGVWKAAVVLVGLAAIGCSGVAGGEQEEAAPPDIEATIEMRVQATVEAIPTPTNLPTVSHSPKFSEAEATAKLRAIFFRCSETVMDQENYPVMIQIPGYGLAIWTSSSRWSGRSESRMTAKYLKGVWTITLRDIWQSGGENGNRFLPDEQWRLFEKEGLPALIVDGGEAGIPSEQFTDCLFETS